MEQVEQADLERRLLSSITSQKDLILAQDSGISRDTFITPSEGRHDEVWDYIEDHVRENGRCPVDDDLRTIYGFEPGAPGDLKTYVSLARKRELTRCLRAIMEKRAIQLSENPDDPEPIVRSINEDLASLRLGERRSVTFIDADAQKRMHAFMARKNIMQTRGMLGIPTGLAAFDKQGRGFMPGEVVVVVGPTGTGKSWALTHMMCHAYEDGQKILMISPELTTDEVALRFDTMLMCQRNVQVLRNTELTIGTADPKLYASWLKDLATERRFACADNAGTGKPFNFDDIWRLALEHKPAIVVIDGLHLISSGRRGGERAGWEVLKEGVEMLKALAQQEKIVVLCAHQSDRAASRKENVPPGLASIGYGFSVSQACDRFISLSRDPDDPMQRLYKVPKFRGGAPIVEDRTLRWDVDRGIVHEIGFKPDAAFGEDDENDFA